MSIGGTLASNGNGVGSGGSITLFASNGSVTAGNISSTGTSGGNVTVVATNGISLGNIDTSATGAGSGGYVIASTGASSNAATLGIGSITTAGTTNGGLVMLVNSAANTSSNNLTVSGIITTDATGVDGAAGPVSLVASGGIAVQDISLSPREILQALVRWAGRCSFPVVAPAQPQ